MDFNLVELLKDIGIPVALLIVLLYKVVIPVTDSHLAMVRSLKVSIEELTKSQTNLQETVNHLSRTLTVLENKFDKCHGKEII